MENQTEIMVDVLNANYDLLRKLQKVSDARGYATPEEKELASELSRKIEEIDRVIDGLPKRQKPIRSDFNYGKPLRQEPANSHSFAVSPGPGRKHYRSLFPDEKLSTDGFRDFRDFFYTVMSGQPNMNLRAMSEGEAGSGGYLVPSEFTRELFDVSLEDEIVRPRATIYPMESNERKIPATTIGDHSDNLYGGVICLWKAEASSLSSVQPRFRDMTLTARKLTAFGVASNELAADGINFDEAIGRIFPKAIGWYLDKSFLTGTGAGTPLGILNSSCTLSVSRNTATNIEYVDIANMVSKIHPACFKNAVWVASVSTIPELLQLEVGTGNTHYPVLSESNGSYTMLSRPVIFSEKLSALGTKGDLMFCDFSQYAIGLRKEARLDRSEHLYFDKDQVAYRCILRADGEPLWDNYLTLADGSSKVSPFVVLE